MNRLLLTSCGSKSQKKAQQYQLMFKIHLSETACKLLTAQLTSLQYFAHIRQCELEKKFRGWLMNTTCNKT